MKFFLNYLSFQGLSRTANGLLIAEMDLNLCRQIKDQWGLQVSESNDYKYKNTSEKNQCMYYAYFYN